MRCSRTTARQARALGLDQTRSRTRLAAFRDLISILEAEAGLDRQLAALPTREALRARRGAYLGLTRPELARAAGAHQARSAAPAPAVAAARTIRMLEPYLQRLLPRRHRASGSRAPLLQHPLRREIIAVQLANRLIDTMGMTFLVARRARHRPRRARSWCGLARGAPVWPTATDSTPSWQPRRIA